MAMRMVELGENSEEEGLIFVEGLNSEARQRQRRRRSVASVVSIASIACLVAAGTALRWRRSTSALQSAILALDSEDEHCHTAREGESCYRDVQWAMSVGITNHRVWYGGCPGIKAESSPQEFQACLFKLNHTTCPLPCNPTSVIPQTVVDQTRRDDPRHAVNQPISAPCHIVKRGEACYNTITEAMLRGIHEEPDKFPGLTKDSTFEEFQASLHHGSAHSSCPRPCDCKAADVDSSCFGHVQWALNSGLKKHPDWYEGLSQDATFNQVQGYLHKDAKDACPLPCSGITAESLKEEAAAVAEEKSTTRTPGITCNEQVWPDVVGGTACGECKALVDRFNSHYKTCNGFCQEIGRHCISAAQSSGSGDECIARRETSCSEALDEATAICECGEVLSEAEQAVLAVLAPTPAPRFPDLDTTETKEEHSDEPLALTKHDHEENHCHTTQEGETCYKNVLYGMNTGLFLHPEWYPGLNQFSSFEEFQAVLHENPDLKCPKPCSCRSAKKGEACYDNVKWVLHEGIKSHPEWYPGLTERSRWEEVQARLHEDVNTTCHNPCTPKVWGTPSLFCFAVFRSEGYELDLVKSQVEKGVGIFSCDEFATLSDKELAVTDVIKTLIIPPCEEVGISKDGTAANTLVFMQAWSVISNDVRYKAHDWVIKADPDAVLIIDRLRAHLAPYTGENVWIKNCMKWTGPGWPMMFGSLEAFSHKAMETYFEGADRCKSDLQWQAWGEDLFMGNCLEMLGAKSEFDGGLIGDNVCKGADCSDGTTAAYHPFKSPEEWFGCYYQAMGENIFK